MTETPTDKLNAAARRRSRRPAFAGAALAATALTAAITPPAAPPVRNLEVALAAEPIAYPAFGIGPLGDLLVNLANAAGMNPITVPDPIGVTYNLLGGTPTTQSIYQNLINGLPYTPVADIPFGAACSRATQTSCRTAFMISTGIGSLGTMDTTRALIESALGETRPGFEPLAVAAGTGMTQISSININNMLRPDGGLAARFPEVMTAFGLNPALPGTDEFGPNTGGSSVYNWITNITWPYNTLADFPITANPFALANSMLAVVPPPSYLGLLLDPDLGILAKVQVLTTTTAGTISGSGLPDGPLSYPPSSQCSTTGACEGWSASGLIPLKTALGGGLPYPLSGQDLMLAGSFRDEIPLTYPTRVTSWLVNPLLKALNSPYLLGTPTSDVLTPPLKILVNVGYDDVITPAKLDTVDPVQGVTFRDEKYSAYDRTYYQTPTPTPFAWFTNPALTSEGMAAVPGDVLTAFTEAVKAQAEKPAFGILVPNPDVPPTTPTAAPAAAEGVADSDPAEAEPVADVADDAADDTPRASDDNPGRGERGGRASAAGHDSPGANAGSRPARGGR